jgi:serine/threonine-protein kinase
MEYLSGESMNDRVSRGPMPAAEVALIADQICRALSAAHAKGIVHRDLKPHNVHIQIDEEGKPQVKLLDFGVAKILGATDTAGQSVKTRTGSLMGTPLYMSPEQCRGSGTLDHRTDIYSLGVMIYEMLAGRPPFTAEGVGELFAKHMLEEPPPLLEFAPETPPAMAAAVMRSLAKSLDERFATMEDFRSALVKGAAGGPLTARTAAVRPTGTVAPPSARQTHAQQSTTLSSASSEIEDDLTPPRRRSGLAIGAVALVAAGVLAVVFLKRPSHVDSPTSSAASAPAPVPIPTPPPPPEPAMVTIRMEATPVGTHVFRASDDKDLGPVPVELKVPKSTVHAEYVFRSDGYKLKALTIEPNVDRTVHAALEKELPPPPAPLSPPRASSDTPKKPVPPHRPSSRRRSPNPDEDGLATPNF